jgi:uncharacterized protein (DUF111 family)
VLRPSSGIAGDIMAAGLARMAGFDDRDLDEALGALGLPELVGRVKVAPRLAGGISGWGLELSLPSEQRHRGLGDIGEFFAKSALTPAAKGLALESFRLLAEAEAAVHGSTPSEVRFHEVGALDSIIDAGLCSLLFDLISPDVFVSGPLPVCDGTVSCAHGLLPSPAPAVLRMLEGVPVRGIVSEGETVTPTGISLLKAFGAVFGPWPAMTVDAQAISYGCRTLPGVPNGAMFALGRLQAASGPDGGHDHAHA